MTKAISPLVTALGMEPHPEGGWYKEMWKANFQIPKPVLPDVYSGPRFAASSTYFLLHPGEFSEWHVVHSDELWLYHSGSPVELKLGGSGDVPGEETVIIVGADVEAGQHPQALVPGTVWQTARPLGDEPVLVTCVVAPGFHFDDFKLFAKNKTES